MSTFLSLSLYKKITEHGLFMLQPKQK